MMTLPRTDESILNTLAEAIREQVTQGYERLDMDRLMVDSVWSRRQMERKFRDRFLTSPARYFRDYQTEIAGEMLANGEDVLSASTKSGFASPGRLHDAVVVRYGMTPGEVRRRGEGVAITFGFFETQIGIVLLGATARGVSWIALCGAEVVEEVLASRIDELRKNYPNADLCEEPEQVQVYADQLVAYLEDRTPQFLPPLDILQGTTFQREVWSALQTVKPGETITYAQLAEKIGKPKAVRAVAQACGSNNLAIAIPCHRCVRSDGTLAGYRWGVEWKSRLLEIEAELQSCRLN